MAEDENKDKSNNNLKAKISAFTKKNKTLVYLLPVFAVLIIVLIVVYSTMGTSGGTKGGTAQNTAGTAETMSGKDIESLLSDTENKVEVLPNVERSRETQAGAGETAAAGVNAEAGGEEILYNPFEQPITLSGILYADDGNSVAILETVSKSYVVRKGDVVGSVWKVEQITDSTVVLKAGEKETTLMLSDGE
jgi:hypothetical protein